MLLYHPFYTARPTGKDTRKFNSSHHGTDHATGGASSPKPSLVAPQPDLVVSEHLPVPLLLNTPPCLHNHVLGLGTAARLPQLESMPPPMPVTSLGVCRECLPQERALSLLQLSQHTEGLGPALKANRHLEKVKQGQRNKFSTTKTCSRGSFLFYYKRKEKKELPKRHATYDAYAGSMFFHEKFYILTHIP